MNDFADGSIDNGFSDQPQNNITHDLDHLGADVIDAPPMDQPMAPMRPQLSEEEEEERRELLMLAKRIRTSKNGKIKLDQDMLMKLEPSNLQFLSNEEIEDIVSDAKFEIATHHSASATNMMFTGGAMVVEKVLGTFTPIKTNGFAAVVNPARNSEIELLLEEMSFDMRPKHVPAHIRLAYAVSQALYAVHNANEALEAKVAEQLQRKEATQKVVDTLKDLPQ